jgi:hypothetical protein
LTACDSIASGAGCVVCYANNGYRYARVRVTAAAAPNDTTCEAWLVANVN